MARGSADTASATSVQPTCLGAAVQIVPRAREGRRSQQFVYACNECQARRNLPYNMRLESQISAACDVQ